MSQTWGNSMQWIFPTKFMCRIFYDNFVFHKFEGKYIKVPDVDTVAAGRWLGGIF